MKPGDIRSTPPKAFGECYVCRRLFDLDDLTPVTSSDSADWRYICPLCRDVAKTTRPKPETRQQIANRILLDRYHEDTSIYVTDLSQFQ